jgi:hypothetical protein
MAVIRGTARCALLEPAQDHEDPALSQADRQRQADRPRNPAAGFGARPLGPPIVAEVLNTKDAWPGTCRRSTTTKVDRVQHDTVHSWGGPV